MGIPHAEGEYVVTGGSDRYWRTTNASTLTRAKRIASLMYQPAVGRKIRVAQVRGGRYIPVAVKYGFDRWQAEE